MLLVYLTIQQLISLKTFNNIIKLVMSMRSDFESSSKNKSLSLTFLIIRSP
jgi:hypothetical protein